LVNMAKDLSILLIILWNQFLFYDSYIVLSVSISLIYCLIFPISFHILIWSSVCSWFSNSLRCIIRLFVWDICNSLL
jgi:hypothetical protein